MHDVHISYVEIYDISLCEMSMFPFITRIKLPLFIIIPNLLLTPILIIISYMAHSGLAVKHMIDCGAGVVDADYRGNVGVVLFNFGPSDFEINVGDRIAQLILEQISMVPAVQVEELTETVRGEGGFGSTGVSSSTSKGDDGKEKGEEPVAKVQRVISPNNVAMGEE
jgi:hypothetical protein